MAPVCEATLILTPSSKRAGGGHEYLLVEQDDCYGEDPFECLRVSYQNLKARGL